MEEQKQEIKIKLKWYAIPIWIIIAIGFGILTSHIQVNNVYTDEYCGKETTGFPFPTLIYKYQYNYQSFLDIPSSPINLIKTANAQVFISGDELSLHLCSLGPDIRGFNNYYLPIIGNIAIFAIIFVIVAVIAQKRRQYGWYILNPVVILILFLIAKYISS